MAVPPSQPDRRAGRRIDWWLVGLLILPILYFLPEVLGFSVFAGIDTSRLNMPFRYFDRLAFASGALPLWNPYLFAGFPGLAESESGVFYPGNLFIHLPGDFFHWYSIEVVAHFMVAGGGFYTWMRQRGHSQLVAAFLGATYCTTPFLIFHITALGLFTSIVWLPWYLVIFESGLRGKHPVRTGLWLALFLGVMLLAGSVQAVFLGVLALVLYAIGTIIAQPDGTARKRALVRSLAVLLPCLIAPVIAAIQLMPTAELTRFSERAATDSIEFYRIGTWLTLPRLISLFIFPALGNPADIQDYGSSLCFLGIVPFVFAIATLTRWRERGREMFPLLFVGIVALVLAFGLNLPGYEHLVEIPPFSMFRYPGRAAHVAFTFFLALAAPSIGLLWRRTSEERKEEDALGFVAWIAVGIVTLVALFAWWWASGPLRVGLLDAWVLGIIVEGLIILSIRRDYGSRVEAKLARFSFIALLLLSLAAQIALTYPFSRVLVQERGQFDKSLAFFDDILAEFPTDMEIPRVLMPGSHYLMDPDALSKLGFRAQSDIWDNMSGNAAGLRGVTALRGLTPLNQNNWKLVLRDTLQSRMDETLRAAREEGAEKVPDDVCMRIIRMLGTDVLLLEGDDWQVPGYELWRTDLELPFHEGLCAYRAEDGWVPDAYFVEEVRIKPEGYAEFLQWIGTPGLDVESEALHQGVYTIAGDASYYSKAEIAHRERGLNWIRLDVSIEGPGNAFLVTGENYFPGWNAWFPLEVPIPGETIQVRSRRSFRTNFLLCGVELPAGEYTAELRYRPESVWLGTIASLSGLVIWALLIGVVILIRRRGRPTSLPPIKPNG